MYPALVNCTTIDLFNEWPPDALLEVGERYLRDVDLEGNEQVNLAFAFYSNLLISIKFNFFSNKSLHFAS